MSSPDERLTELPAGWVWETMGGVAKIVGGSTPKSKQAEFWDGDIPWLAVSDLTGYTDKLIAHGARSITQAGYDSCSTQLVPEGTVLFSSRAPIGYVAIAANPICTSQGFRSFVLDRDRLCPEYVYWYLQFAKPLAESLASGTTFKELSGRAAASMPIPVPSIEEQERIAAFLDAQMDLVARGTRALQASVARLDSFRAALLSASLSGSMNSIDRGLANELESAPRHQLGELARIQYGYTASASSDTDGLRLLRITDIQAGRVDWSAVPYCDAGPAELEKYGLRAGDIVFARMGFTTGKSYLIGNDAPPNAVFASYLIRVRPSDELLPEFLALYFQSGEYWRYVYSRRQGIDRPTLNGKILGALPVPVPSLAAQERAVEVATRHLLAVEQTRSVLETQMGRASQLESSLLHSVFSGAVRLVDDNAHAVRSEAYA